MGSAKGALIPTQHMGIHSSSCHQKSPTKKNLNVTALFHQQNIHVVMNREGFVLGFALQDAKCVGLNPLQKGFEAF